MTSEELMRRVRELEITTRHAVTEVLAGEYSSAFKGRGMEFAEVREYQPGDDVRAIDWNVTARAGRPFVKRFTEERELTVMLLVDLSGSGRFGSVDRLKQELATEVCALLAFAAIRKNDRVGLLIFTDRVELYIPPKKGSRHTLRLIRELLAFRARGIGTDLRCATDHLARVLKRRAVVFVVSDFLMEDYEEPMRRLRHASRGHDAVAIRVSDPRERALAQGWGPGLIEIEDAETEEGSGARRLVDTSSGRVRRLFEANARRREGRFESAMQRLGVDTVGVSTGKAYIHDLAVFFRERNRRR